MSKRTRSPSLSQHLGTSANTTMSRTHKRLASSLESPASDAQAAKRYKTDPIQAGLSSCLTSIADATTIEIQSGSAGDMFGFDLASDFASSGTVGGDMPGSFIGLDSFLMDAPAMALDRHSSQVSTDDDDDTTRLEYSTIPSSPVNSEDLLSDHLSKSVTQTGIDAHRKRQADRAARNRESSRRAREKAKHRVRSLESENMELRAKLGQFKMQNEHLISQLYRSQAMQQACTMCRFNAALVQPAPCRIPQQGSLLRK